MGSPLAGQSIVTYRGYRAGGDCGYCHSAGTKKSRGMWAHALNVCDYDDLINRNWRRSGRYCYQPMMKDTCCPQYMIYCNALEFRPSRHQRKVINRMNRFLSTGEQGRITDDEANRADQLVEAEGQPPPTHSSRTTECREAAPSSAERNRSLSVEIPEEIRTRGYETTMSTDSAASLGRSTENVSGFQSEAQAKIGKKAKQLRWERKLARLASRGEQPQMQEHRQMPTPAKTLENLLDEHRHCTDRRHKLELRLVRSSPRSPEMQSTLAEEYSIYKKYQMKIHKDSAADCTQEQFERFLIESPLLPLKMGDVDYGSFHYQYVLDGRVIAVEVMDILPTCISSKYFFYDPEYDFLNLGTYSAFCGIRLTRDLQKLAPNLNRYLMGYYIHSCQKMRYKAQFRPSFLLCPETYSWTPLDSCIPLLDASKYSRLFNGIPAKGGEEEDEGNRTLWRRLRRDGRIQAHRHLPNDSTQRIAVEEFVTSVGQHCSSRILLYEP